MILSQFCCHAFVGAWKTKSGVLSWTSEFRVKLWKSRSGEKLSLWLRTSYFNKLFWSSVATSIPDLKPSNNFSPPTLSQFSLWLLNGNLSFVTHLERATLSLSLGFCITYTALLMKTWRVSLTYRVKSAHKVKLTDKQLLQWMVPILLVMGIYLGTWTAADPPTATEVISELSTNQSIKLIVYTLIALSDRRQRRTTIQTMHLQLVGSCDGDRRSAFPSLGHSCLLQRSQCRVALQWGQTDFLRNLQHRWRQYANGGFSVSRLVRGLRIYFLPSWTENSLDSNEFIDIPRAASISLMSATCLCQIFPFFYSMEILLRQQAGKNICCRIFTVSKFPSTFSISRFLLSPRSLFLFPKAGPNAKYVLGFLRTQLSTTTTILLVFGPKILRVLRGQGDKWDIRSRARGITASFCTNGGGLMPDEGVDLYQENEELKVNSLQLCCRRKRKSKVIKTLN